MNVNSCKRWRHHHDSVLELELKKASCRLITTNLLSPFLVQVVFEVVASMLSFKAKGEEVAFVLKVGGHLFGRLVLSFGQEGECKEPEE